MGLFQLSRDGKIGLKEPRENCLIQYIKIGLISNDIKFTNDGNQIIHRSLSSFYLNT